MVKKGVLREWGFRFSLGFEGSFWWLLLLCTPKFCNFEGKKTLKKREFRLKDAIEKYVGCFLV